MKKTISMYGNCVVSNIFSIARDNNILDFTLTNRFFQINPISLLQSEPLEFLYGFEVEGRFNTAIASIKMDIHKEVFERLKLKKTDYFVIDIVFLYFDLLEITYKNKRYLLTWMWELERFNRTKLFSFLDSIGAEYKVVHSRDNLELIEDTMKLFCNKITEIFEPQQIIFIETSPARLCIRKDGVLDCVNKENIDDGIEYMKYVSNLFLNHVLGCHLIRMINPPISSWNNVFGINPFHYENSYYEYAYEAIEIATSGLEREEEVGKLKALQIQYNEKMEKIKEAAMNKLLHAYRKERIQSSYDQFRNRMIENGEKSYLETIGMINQIQCKHMFGGEKLNDYIRELVSSKESLVLMFSVCDSASKYWHLFTERKKLGLRDEVDFRTSYVAIYDIDSNKLIERYEAKNDEIIYNCNIITRDSNYIMSSDLNHERVNYFSVLISSKAWEWNKVTGEYKCWSRIMINNVDYSRNKIGLNVVVFSKDEQCVVDSFSVNLHGDSHLMILR